jgi:hypothetical protein
MTLNTPLPADHQRDHLAGPCAHGRQTRPHPDGRIPQPLWEQAVALAAALPPSRVAQQLRLRVADLKKQIERRHAAPAALASQSLGVVDVPPAWPPSTAATQLELSRTDGTRLCIHTPASTLPLDAVVRACVEGRSCSN